MAKLRNRIFSDFGEVVAAVRGCLSEYNARPFQKREGSRDAAFPEAGAAQLRPLPSVRYDAAQRAHDRAVNLDFRVVCAKNRCSVPHRFAGCKVDPRVGESTMGIYHAGERAATHRLLPSYVANSHSTDPAHMPEASLKPEWDDGRIKRRASEIGPDCTAVIERLFDRVKTKEQAYNPALSVLNLSKRYGRERLEAACSHALPRLASPRYRHLKAILDSGLDGQAGSAEKAPSSRTAPRGHVRGADCCKD